MPSDISQCNGCGSILHDDYLVIANDEDGYHKACPFCLTDNMLMDIDDLPEDREDR